MANLVQLQSSQDVLDVKLGGAIRIEGGGRFEFVGANEGDTLVYTGGKFLPAVGGGGGGAAAAGTLTGVTLAANVLASSLTSVGVLVSPHMTNPVIDTGSLTGNVIGNASTATLAASSTILATARAINGVNFDGSAPITVPAAAGTLTGATLASNVLASSLTSVGILAAPHMTSPVIDSGGLVVTSGGITVSAGAMSVTGNGGSYIGVAVAGGATLRTLTPGAHTAVVAEVIDSDFAAHTMTITGGYATQRFTLFRAPTITAGSALTVTTAATVAIAGPPIAAGSAVITNPLSLWVQLGQTNLTGAINTSAVPATWIPSVIVDNAATSTFNVLEMRLAGTKRGSILVNATGGIFLSGTGTQPVYLNYLEGTGGVTFGNGAGASSASMSSAGVLGCNGLTISDGAPFVFGTTTGTKIGTATTQKLGMWNATPVVQPVRGVTATNNVVASGTTDQFDDFTNLSTYATDAAAIHATISQLCRIVRLHDVNLRATGIMS